MSGTLADTIEPSIIPHHVTDYRVNTSETLRWRNQWHTI